MKSVRALSVVLLAAFALTACDDEGTTGVEIADLAGFWTATRFEYTDITGDAPGFGLDIIAERGGTVTLDVTENGTFSGSIDVPGITSSSLPIGGTFSLIDDEHLTVDFDEQTESHGLVRDFDATYALSGTRLTLVDDDTTFDFPDEEEDLIGLLPRGEVAAELTVTLER